MNNNQWNGNNNNGPSNYDQWKSSNSSQAQQPPAQPSQPDPQQSDLETNPAIVYAKASSEYHVQYNQYTAALQQAMQAQQAGTPISPQQQQYLIVRASPPRRHPSHEPFACFRRSSSSCKRSSNSCK